MSRTLLDLDDDALAAAMTALGTQTKVATVNEALRRAAAEGGRREALLRELDRGEFYRAAVDGETEAWQ